MRAVATAFALALLVSGCDGGGDPRPEDRPGTSEAPVDDRTPAERLGLTTGWGPSRAELERAARAVHGLPLPQLAGQVIVARYAGTAAPVSLVRRLHLGGVVVFSDNVVSTGQVRTMTVRLRREVGRPLIVSVRLPTSRDMRSAISPPRAMTPSKAVRREARISSISRALAGSPSVGEGR